MEKKRSAGKIIGIVLLCICILILLLMLAAFIYFNSLLGKIDRTEITGDLNLSEDQIYETPTVDVPDSIDEIEQVKQEFEDAQAINIAQNSGVENILLIGTDYHNKGENGRSDTMILLSLNYNTGKIHMTSLMRAMYVCIPRSDGNVWGMLNAAYSWGGPNLLIDTIELNFRVAIDKYVVVDFSAFEKAVDMLGGIELTISEAEAHEITIHTPVKTSAGTQILNGAQTRGYCQIRATDNDFIRTSRQRQVIDLLIKKAEKMDIATLLDMANELLPLVNTNLNNSEIWLYITKALPMLKNVTTGRMLPVENEAGKSYTGIIYVNGREMYRVNFAHNIKELHDYINS